MKAVNECEVLLSGKLLYADHDDHKSHKGNNSTLRTCAKFTSNRGRVISFHFTLNMKQAPCCWRAKAWAKKVVYLFNLIWTLEWECVAPKRLKKWLVQQKATKWNLRLPGIAGWSFVRWPRWPGRPGAAEASSCRLLWTLVHNALQWVKATFFILLPPLLSINLIPACAREHIHKQQHLSLLPSILMRDSIYPRALLVHGGRSFHRRNAKGWEIWAKFIHVGEQKYATAIQWVGRGAIFFHKSLRLLPYPTIWWWGQRDFSPNPHLEVWVDPFIAAG